MLAYSPIDPSALLLVIVANSTPALLTMLLGDRWARAIDAGLNLPDGRPVFGPHKTWRGLAGGILAAGSAGMLLSVGFATGAAFGLLALLGDLLSSFLKRRLGRSSGQSTPILDQAPEALLPMLVLQDHLALGASAMLGTTAVFTLLDIIAAKVLDSRRTPSR